MSKPTTTKKTVAPAVPANDPYAVGEDLLKLYQRSFDTAFNNSVKMIAFGQNMAEDMWAQVKDVQDNSIRTVKEFIKDVQKTQDAYWKELEAGWKQLPFAG